MKFKGIDIMLNIESPDPDTEICRILQSIINEKQRFLDHPLGTRVTLRDINHNVVGNIHTR